MVSRRRRDDGRAFPPAVAGGATRSKLALCALTTANPFRGESETAWERRARRLRNGLLHDDIAASIAQIGTDRPGLSVASHDVGDEVPTPAFFAVESSRKLCGRQIRRLDVKRQLDILGLLPPLPHASQIRTYSESPNPSN